ncbi:hypothetical protein BDP55DRAFT_760670 [Colletotrichum godetiae]|uniref:BRCT domain-containing protein n=1 Tax=Colletotrichum godetiae TaxID=1209918 RepID=A0AAJ0EMQ3_9PEZI|nr:uncharacterized protein BDP55DRAFT_760670 [Colletotrichum godetiae]KAK1657721.1 hypothetical protein BDP55DRAFT_760670 [Colletotrichum godetiae]
MSETHGPLTGRNISVCGKFENRTQDDIVEEISRLGGIGFKNKLPDDAFCVICTSEATEKNKTVQGAIAKDVPLVSVQWLDDGGSPANIQQFLIGPNKDNAEDESVVSPEIQSTPPQQIIDPPKPETPETRSGKDRYEGNTESVESTPTRKPSNTIMERLGSAYQAITGTPRKKSFAPPPAGEATGSPEDHALESNEMREKAQGPGPTDSSTYPSSTGEEGDLSSPSEASSFKSYLIQDEGNRPGSATESMVPVSPKNPPDHWEGDTQVDLPLSSASHDIQIESGREVGSRGDPRQESAASPIAPQDRSGREGSTQSNPIQVSSASPDTQVASRPEVSSQRNINPVSVHPQDGSGREGSTESNPIQVSSASPEAQVESGREGSS